MIKGKKMTSAMRTIEGKELQEVTYGIYNGITPIFTKIESFAKAQAVFYNTAKACAILGLRCDLVNERTGEVIE